MQVTQGSVTINSIRFQAQSRPDFIKNPFVNNQEWLNWIQQSYNELYGILSTEYGEDYNLNNYCFTTDGNNYQYSLPIDYFKLRGVQVDRGNGFKLTQTNFSMRDRNNGSWLPGLASQCPRYRIVRNQIWFDPKPAAGLMEEILYTPRPATLSECGTIACQGTQNGDSITINGLVYTFNPGSDHDVAQWDTINATNLAIFINQSFPYQLTATVGSGVNPLVSNVVYIQIYNPQQSQSFLATAISPSFQSFPGVSWTNTIDGVAGWEHYVIVRAAQMALLKDESLDSWNSMGQELAMIKQSIIDDAANRNAADPEVVSISGIGTATGGGGYGGFGGWGEY